MNRVDSSPDWDSQLDLFHGDVSPNLARLYARLPRSQESTGYRWQGTVRGPFVRDRRTLPMTTPWQDLGPGPTMLAQALITDPVCWSPEQPAWYEVEITLQQAGTIVGTFRRPLAIRRLGDNGTRWRWDQQLWRLTAIAAETVSKPAAGSAPGSAVEAAVAAAAEALDWADLRSRKLSLVVRKISPAAAMQALRWGVPLVLWVDAYSDASWMELVREPAVTFAVLPAGDARGEWLREHAPNIIRLERHSLQPTTEGPPAAPRASWAQAVAMLAGELDQARAPEMDWLISTLLSRGAGGNDASADGSGGQRVPLVVLHENSAAVDAVPVQQAPGRLPTAGCLLLTQELLRNRR